MDAFHAAEMGRAAMMLVLTIAGPMLLASLVVGVAISLFQALTQLQEPTITFVPKLLVIGTVILGSLPFIGQAMAGFMARIADAIVTGA
ncbi:flagellar biosynthesis protein FliQ [Sphingomonas endophytica]|uniref:Flagellar biosynthetic protein FliQ n=1 Tax=Sphingomonas endophytica TaxID=869719 RepID=A0ABR6N5A5_9SPHN|nr:flagellar biosynthetic protein FliQ [Sphingomonas endophytica]MBB5725679.1 flagellar biosynthetic protein FliQ [Sphingomonas endophytica]